MDRAETDGLKRETLAEWEFYPNVSAPRRWAEELVGLVKGDVFNPVDWTIAGRAVLVEDDDTDLAAEIIGQVAKTAGFRLVTISREDVWSGFEAWMGQFVDPAAASEPAILFLQPGMWMTPCNEDLRPYLRFAPEAEFDAARAGLFRLELVRFIREKIVSQPLVVVTVVRSEVQLDENLRRPGLFDRRIGLPELATKDLAEAFVRNTGPEIFEDGALANPKRLGNFLKSEYENDRRRLGLMQVAMHRMHRRERRKIVFRDMLEFSLYGTLEKECRQQCGHLAWRTAVHEAGHVLVRYLTTPQRVIPEYCGITGRGDMLGITVDCYSTPDICMEERTRQDMIASVRLGLGGRAAEHVVLGLQLLSAGGSRSDLERVTSMARSMIEDLGLPLCDEPERAADHLMVSMGSLSDSEGAYNESRIRDFLRRHYQHCVDLLDAHKGTLLHLAEELCTRVILEQHEIRKILESADSAVGDVVVLPKVA
jgi:cell division protease FtsH